MKALRIGFWPVAAAVVLLLVGGSILFVRVINLGQDNHAAIARTKAAQAATKTLSCQIGGFLVDAPVVKLPGTSQHDFEQQVAKAVAFLRALRDQNCSGLSHVTTAKINAQIANLRQVAPGAAGGGGSGGGHAAPTPPGTASTLDPTTTTTPSLTPPSGGPTTPTTTPTIPTTTTPKPPPPPEPPLPRLVCRRVPVLCDLGLLDV